MATLNTSHKEYIIKCLACFHAPSEVQSLMERDFGIPVSIQQIVYYDPNKSFHLAEKWRYLFQEARKKYIDDVVSVPISNKGYRMRQLQRLFDECKKSGNIMLQLQILEQAAKEVGGQFEKEKEPPKQDFKFYQQINNLARDRLS
jgi:hypothetical protein